MSDEPEMNPELESFAASLRNTGASEAKIDREQLMYDAGLAAAISQHQPVAAVTHKHGMPTIALSFVSGIAVAAAVLLSVVPFAIDRPSSESGSIAESKPTSPIPIQVATQPVDDAEDTDARQVDLLDWIDNLPPGHSVAAGFSSRPVSPEFESTKVSLSRPTNQFRREPTTHLLMQELVPRTRQREVFPDWTGWLSPGT